MSTAVLTFDSHGTGSCLYTELIDLQQLGSLQMERASTIEFNESGQVWEVRAESELLFSNRSRAVCFAWEHQHFNR